LPGSSHPACAEAPAGGLSPPRCELPGLANPFELASARDLSAARLAVARRPGLQRLPARLPCSRLPPGACRPGVCGLRCTAGALAPPGPLRPSARALKTPVAARTAVFGACKQCCRHSVRAPFRAIAPKAPPGSSPGASLAALPDSAVAGPSSPSGPLPWGRPCRVGLPKQTHSVVTLLGFPASYLAGASGLSLSVASRPLKPGRPDHGSSPSLRAGPLARVTPGARRVVAGWLDSVGSARRPRVQLPTGYLSPAACSRLVTGSSLHGVSTPSRCALLRRPSGRSRSLPSWAFAPPSRYPLVGWPISRWTPLMTFLLRAFKLTRSPGLQRLPPASATPFSRQVPTAVAFSAFQTPGDKSPTAVISASQRASEASRLAVCQAALQGVPRALPASGCSPGAPTLTFLASSWVRVQRASVAAPLPACS
jgi:hypothetical protein